MNKRVYYLIHSSQETLNKLFMLVKGLFNKFCFKHMIMVLIRLNELIAKDLGLVTKKTTTLNNEEVPEEDHLIQNNCIFYMSNLYNDETNLIKTYSMEMFDIKNTYYFISIKEFFHDITIDFVTKETELKYIATSYAKTTQLLGTKKLLQLEYIKQTLEIIVGLYELKCIKYDDFSFIILDFCKSSFMETAIVNNLM